MSENPFRTLFPDDPRIWLVARDGDSRAVALYHRHYSYRKRPGIPPKLILGPGEKMVLVSPDGLAVFGWQRQIDRDDGQEGVNCAVFRNEGPRRSSDLILAAEEIALRRWPGARFFTYVRAEAVSSPNPGYCFKVAGWRQIGKSKSGLILLEKRQPKKGG